MAIRSGTYYTGTVNGLVGSLTTALDAILVTGEGWAIEFTATNRRVYRPPAGNRFRLRVQDDAGTPGGGLEAICRAAEVATDINTLVDPFPTVAQQSDANCVWRKSDTADSTARNYWAWADDRCIVIGIESGSFSSNTHIFGDLVPLFPGDNYCTVHTFNRVGNSSNDIHPVNVVAQLGPYSTAITAGLNFARTEDGLLKSPRGSLIGLGSSHIGGSGASSGVIGTYPHPRTLDLLMAPISVMCIGGTTTAETTSNSLRAIVPGVFQPFLGWDSTTSLLAIDDTFTDTAYDSGAEFILKSDQPPSFNRNTFAVQTAADWRSPTY